MTDSAKKLSAAKFLRTFLSIGACCLIAACGGGGGGDNISSGNPPPVADSATPVTSTGRITGFGSIIMNGEEIETDDASHEKDEEPASGDDDFEKGMVVTVEAEERDGTLHALHVSYDPELEGPIEGLVRNDEDGTITGAINDVRVILSSTNTHFDDISFDTIMEGDCLEVDGEMNEDTLIATYAEACDLNEDGDHEREFTGEVFEVLGDGFVIGEWTVLTDDDTEIEGDPQVGDLVEVECVDTMNAKECLAKEIEPEDEYEPRGDKIHVEGFVADYEGDTFFIRDHEINTADARLPDGFGNGVPVRVKGRRNDGVINADSIKIATMAAHIKAEGLVAGVDDSEGESSFDLMLFDQVVTFAVDPLVTEWDDDDDAIDDRAFDLSQITVDDFLEVKAEMAEGGGYLALRVEREDDEGKDKVTARVEAVDNDLQELTLIGITVSADADTKCKLFTGDHSCERFFDIDNGIMVDHLVKAKGMRIDNVATELKTKHFGDDFGHDDHDIELKGTISGFVPETMHFMLGDDIEVDASMARLEPADLMLEDGLYVEVEGEWIEDVFKAHVVELEDDEDAEEAGEVTGYVATLDDTSICVTLVASQDCVAFAINDATEIESEVGEESFVEVEFDDALTALEVEGKDDDEIEFEGPLDDILTEDEDYLFVVLGTTFRSKNTTRYEVDDMDVEAAAFVEAWMADTTRVVKLEDEIPHDGYVDKIEL